MIFHWPQLLWLLLLPVAWLAWELADRRRHGPRRHPKILEAEAGTSLLAFTAQASSPRRKPRWWLALALVFALVALARPQWGRLEEPVFDQSREILLALDLSRSMLTPDVKPSRLERSKLLVQSLLEKLAGERVGLVVFSGTAFLQSPLSSDYEVLREFLPNLGPDYLPEGGTNYQALLDTALQAFGSTSAADRFLIILSDGEATDEEWKSLLPELKKHDIRVIGLGVGTAAGAIIPDGGGGFVKDDRGAVVLSKLEPATLQALAQATGGAYRDASSWVDLSALLQQTVDAGQKGKFVEKNTVLLAERFQWPLALALAALLLSLSYEFPVRPRPREIRVAPPGGGPQATAVATTVAVLALVLAAGAPAGRAVTAAAPADAGPAATLSKIVGRLAGSTQRSAQDWAELAQETLGWGRRLQTDQHPVPPGPVEDALAGVARGAAANPNLANWAELKASLEKLLEQSDQKKKPDKPTPDPAKSDDQKKDGQKSDDDKKSPDKKSDPGKPPEDKKNEGQPTPSPSNADKSDQDANPQNQPSPKPGASGEQNQSAFGDMKSPSPTPAPPPGEMQKVGGAPEKDKPESEAARQDPALALPMQKLDQVRSTDSPARLFQLMEGERKPRPKTGKDW